jgi:hypothetical protein
LGDNANQLRDLIFQEQAKGIDLVLGMPSR